MDQSFEWAITPKISDYLSLYFDNNIKISYSFEGMTNPIQKGNKLPTNRPLTVNYYLPNQKMVICHYTWMLFSSWYVENLEEIRYRQEIDVFKYNFLKNIGIRAYFLPPYVADVHQVMGVIVDDIENVNLYNYWKNTKDFIPRVFTNEEFDKLAKIKRRPTLSNQDANTLNEKGQY